MKDSNANNKITPVNNIFMKYFICHVLLFYPQIKMYSNELAMNE